jgi:hypothetical protein
MIDGEANASVELTPNMAGPAFDALEKFKKDGTQPEKVDHHQIHALPAGHGERRVREEEKYGLLSSAHPHPSPLPGGEREKGSLGRKLKTGTNNPLSPPGRGSG